MIDERDLLNKKTKCVLYEDEDDKPLFYNFDFRKERKRLVYLLDWLSVILVLVIGGILFLKVNVRGRLFALNDPEISYPKLEEIVPMHMLIPIIVLIPLVMIAFISLVVKRDVHDFHHGILGLAQSIACTLLLTGIWKCFVGGLRPSFLEFCVPTAESIAAATPVGYGGMYYDRSVCTESESVVNDGMAAYPSGHTSISAASFGYLALYLHAKLKVFDHRGHLFIYILTVGCVTGFALIGISRVADYRHTFLNVLAGWFIGISIALSCYRLNFRSLFGYDNHKSIHSHWISYWDHHRNIDANKSSLQNNQSSLNNGRNSPSSDLENCTQSPNNDGISLNELN